MNIVCASSHKYHFPAERVSFSDVEADLLIKSINMAKERKVKIVNILCVLIKHIISCLKGPHLEKK